MFRRTLILREPFCVIIRVPTVLKGVVFLTISAVRGVKGLFTYGSFSTILLI